MRLITRSDFDGLVCAVLLEEVGLVTDYLFCHPHDLQRNNIPVTKDDIIANAPYVEGCGLWFDHHYNNITEVSTEFQGAAYEAPSAARVVFEYYGAEKNFQQKFVEIIPFVDKVDSADLTKEEILNPDGWILLGFIMDPRTGLGYYPEFQISNYQLMSKMISLIRNHTLDQIYEDPDVLARVSFYYQHVSDYITYIRERARLVEQIIVFDTRSIGKPPVGNRFLLYGIYPDIKISIQISWGKKKQNVLLSVGKSILNPHKSQKNIGQILAEYGGGGHKNVGTCQVPEERVSQVLEELIAKLSDTE